jgi:hypothetical protein
MGIQLALGSSRSALLRLIVMQSTHLVVAGGVAGVEVQTSLSFARWL